MTNTREVQIGIIGFGFAGRVFHAPVIRATEGVRLSAIVQRSGDEAQKAYPDACVLRSVEELLSLQELDVIVVATANASHHELARRCLLAGKHVVVDKPFTTTLREAEELVELSRRCDRFVTVFQNRRWDGDFQTVRQLMSDQALGRIVSYESHFDRYRPQLKGGWRERNEPGSGILFDLGPHLLDQAMLLFGEPQAISADIRTERDQAVVDDAFEIVLHYSRMRATLRASMLACAAGPRFHLNGTLGSYVKYGLDPQEEALIRSKMANGETFGQEAPQSWGTVCMAQAGTIRTASIPTVAGDYRRYYENVRDAVIKGEPPDVTPKQALNVMRALELARESCRKGQTVSFTEVPSKPR